MVSLRTPERERVGVRPHCRERFYTGNMFPAAYRNAIFVAEHGSWNSSVPVGYRVMAVHVDGRKVTGYDPLIEGFLQSNGRVSGRPADVLVMPDGALLVSVTAADGSIA